jgi:hypothetical protein
VLPPGSLPKTPSGKLKRGHGAQLARLSARPLIRSPSLDHA